MNLRRRINDSPGMSVAIVLVVLAACGLLLWSESSGTGALRPPSSAFFTVDDGLTFFADDVASLPPFEHEGRQAVRAYVFRCPDGTRFVGYLERYTEKARAIMQRYLAEQKADRSKPPQSLGELSAIAGSATEVKRPGDAQWQNVSTGADRKIAEALSCKSGDRPAPVEP